MEPSLNYGNAISRKHMWKAYIADTASKMCKAQKQEAEAMLGITCGTGGDEKWRKPGLRGENLVDKFLKTDIDYYNIFLQLGGTHGLAWKSHLVSEMFDAYREAWREIYSQTTASTKRILTHVFMA